MCNQFPCYLSWSTFLTFKNAIYNHLQQLDTIITVRESTPFQAGASRGISRHVPWVPPEGVATRASFSCLGGPTVLPPHLFLLLLCLQRRREGWLDHGVTTTSSSSCFSGLVAAPSLLLWRLSESPQMRRGWSNCGATRTGGGCTRSDLVIGTLPQWLILGNGSDFTMSECHCSRQCCLQLRLWLQVILNNVYTALDGCTLLCGMFITCT